MKKVLKGVLRFFGLMRAADQARFRYFQIRNYRSNRRFRRDYPEVSLPPDYMMYEAFGLDYDRYYVNGQKSAEWVVNQVAPFMDFGGKKILDWGCGPGRMIRHVPGLLPEAQGFFGTDYNEKTIAWCRQAIPDVTFSLNQLNPPLPFQDAYFDWVYGISIFTHLSEPAHTAWLTELRRILRPGGILLLTLHGEAFLSKLGAPEKRRFQSGQLVVRGQVKEGHRTFIAYHPPAFVLQWSTGFDLLSHEPGKRLEGRISQDTWVFRKSEQDDQGSHRHG